MTIDHFDEEDHFFISTWRPGLSDFELVRYLRRIIAAIGAKLENFGRDTTKNADAVAFEKALLLSAQKELSKLESKLFMI